MSTPVSIDAVPGLFACTEFFSHSIENELYHSRYLFPWSTEQVAQLAADASQDNQRRIGEPRGCFLDNATGSMPAVLVKLCNGIVESGLFPEFIAPNYILPWSYPDKTGQFYYHYDSRYRWGETIVGVTLGYAGVMSFAPAAKNNTKPPPFWGHRVLNQDGLAVDIRRTNNKNNNNYVVDVYLPPRTVYVMSGASRLHWKHAVLVNNDKHRFEHGHPNPAFTAANDDNKIRRTLTMRCTKVFSDTVLNMALQQPSPNNENRLTARIKAQSKFRPQADYGEGPVSDEQLEQMKKDATHQVMAVHATFSRVFFNEQERGYSIQHPNQPCWPLEGAGGRNAVRHDGGFASPGFRLGSTATAFAGGGGDVQQTTTNVDPELAMALRLSMMEEQGHDDPDMATALRLSMEEVQVRQEQNSPPSVLSKEDLRAKRLVALEGNNKRKQPLDNSKPLDNMINLFDDNTSDGDDEEMDSKPAAKKEKPTVIDLDN